MSREIVNSVLLLWGSLFCAVSSLYFWITKNYRTEKRGWIYRMQVSTSVLLFALLACLIGGTCWGSGWSASAIFSTFFSWS